MIIHSIEYYKIIEIDAVYVQSCLFAAPWIVVHQAPLSMKFLRQEYWSGLSCPPPEYLPNPGIKPWISCVSCPGRFSTTSATWGAKRDAAAAKSLQSCLTLCNPTDSSPPGSPIPGIIWARTLEWVAISFSNAGKWKVKVKYLSRVRLLVTPWTAAYQAPPCMGFSRQEY